MSAPVRSSRMWPRRLSVRLTLWSGTLLFLVVSLLGGILYAALDRSLRADLDQQLRESAQYTLTLVELEHRSLQWEGTEPGRVIPDPLPSVEQRHDLVRLIDATGRVVSAPPVLAELPWQAAFERARAGDPDQFGSFRLGREHIRVHTVPVTKNGRFLGALQVVSSLDPVYHTLRLVARLLSFGALAALGLALLAGHFVARRALDPVAAITRSAREITDRSLSRRLRLPDSGDELGELAASFDEMLDRLEDAYRRQREFTANASHELRAPLALIQGEATLATRAGAPPEEMRAALESIRTEAERMSCLVHDLLLLARLDRREPLRTELVGLDELAYEIGGRMRRAARDQGVSLQVDAPEPVVVRGDEQALGRVLLNLLRNALDHTQRGEIRIGVLARDARAEVWVSDTGTGIAAAEQDRVFDRFYQTDRSRSREGAGLGLALCREMVQAHGGLIRLESEEGRGTTVIFELPLATA